MHILEGNHFSKKCTTNRFSSKVDGLKRVKVDYRKKVNCLGKMVEDISS